VLSKDSTLTTSVNAALQSLRDSGRLQELADEWLGSNQGASLLK